MVRSASVLAFLLAFRGCFCFPFRLGVVFLFFAGGALGLFPLEGLSPACSTAWVKSGSIRQVRFGVVFCCTSDQKEDICSCGKLRVHRITRWGQWYPNQFYNHKIRYCDEGKC